MFTLFTLLSIVAILLIACSCKRKNVSRVSLILLLTVAVVLLGGCGKETDSEIGAKHETTQTTEALNKQSEKDTSEVTAAKPSAEHLELAETDVRYKWIVSFLNGDAETCAGMTVIDSSYSSEDKEKSEKLMAEELRKTFDGINIGSYSVEKITDENKNEYLEFDFKITESDSEIFPVGEYSAIVSEWGVFNSPAVYFTKRAGDLKIEDEDEAFFADQVFDSWYGVTDYPKGNSHSPSLALFYLYEHANGIEETWLTRLTPAQLDEIAAEVYAEGFEVDYWPFDYHEGENGEEPYYTVRGMGGVVEYYDLISRTENGKTVTYDVVYYAEPMKLIPAKTFRYTVEKTDSVYGFKLTGVEEIASTGLEIFSQGM